MLILLYVSIFAGIVLYVTKLVSFYSFLSPFPRFKTWMLASPFRLAIVDLFFAYLGMHVISLAAGSVTAMMIMISFGACSITYLSVMTVIIKLKQRKERLEAEQQLRFSGGMV
jgi:hypothetical protein